MTEDPAADRWHVKYTFAEPVRGMVFSRNTNKFRASSWRATSGGKDVAWKEILGREALVIDDPKGAKTIEVSFATDAKTKPSDYELNVAFTEGSRMLFTGHLAGVPMGCSGEPDCDIHDLELDLALKGYDPTAEPRWTFRTNPKRGVLTLDSNGSGELTWRPTGAIASQGTYVYFGGLAPIETTYGRVVLDPGLPTWMRRSAEETIPKLLTWYASETRTAPDHKPLLFLSFGGSDRRGRNFGGGGLPGVAQVDAEGSGWLTETSEARAEWLRFLGHELFHIWNGDLFHRKDSSDAWISEGAADYFAARALVALSESNSKIFADSLVKAANRCLVTLPHGVPLRPQDGTPEYPCGMTFFSWIDHVDPKKAGSASAVLADVFARARAAGSSQYSTAEVLEAAARAGVDKTSIEAIKGAVESGLPADADIFFADRLGAIGIKVDRVAVTETEVDRREMLSAIGVHMARCDCEKRIAFNYDEDPGFIDFNDVPQCNVLRGVRVVEVEGKPLTAVMTALQALMNRKNLTEVRFRREDAKQPETLRCREKTVPRFRRLLRAAGGPKP
ncbi:MAG: hypothetical protein HOV80_04830 [Polyangiaceae bacterium]|nr:hypothetical protein [Polyangiaceae bacterium]